MNPAPTVPSPELQSLDFYVVIDLLNQWIFDLWNKRTKAQHNPNLLKFDQMRLSIETLENKHAFEEAKKLRAELNANIIKWAFAVLTNPAPPENLKSLRELLFRISVKVGQKNVRGDLFLCEVIGRLTIIEALVYQANTPPQLGQTPLALIQLVCQNDTQRPPISSLLQQFFNQFRTTEIWKSTLARYREVGVPDSAYLNPLADLKALSNANIQALLNDLKIVGNPTTAQALDQAFPDKVERAIIERFVKGKLYFKHGTWGLRAILKSGIMLCPTLLGADGVSPRNKVYDHDQYVFGRLSFSTDFWVTRFGDEKLFFEIGALGADISISLHDQEQPFAHNALDQGHTQIIKIEDVVLREIKGDKSQQYWVQHYGNQAYPTSFLQEVFVGQGSCRFGIALSLIRELRRMEPVNPGVVQRLKDRILAACTDQNDSALENIVKDFFRVEIRAPAFIPLALLAQDQKLTDIGCYTVDKKRAPQPVTFDCAELLTIANENSAGHFIFKRLQLAATLLRHHWGHLPTAFEGGMQMLDTVAGCFKSGAGFAELTKPIEALAKKDRDAAPILHLKNLCILGEALRQNPPQADLYACLCGAIYWQSGAKLITLAFNKQQLYEVKIEDQPPVLPWAACNQCQQPTLHRYTAATLDAIGAYLPNL